jgi:hypothetical protein
MSILYTHIGICQERNSRFVKFHSTIRNVHQKRRLENPNLEPPNSFVV